MLLLGQVYGSSGGWFQEEKRSLLDFKAAYSNDSLLPSWVDDPKSNCCNWDRVTCDSFSGHVITLSLQGLYRGMSDTGLDCLDHPSLNWSLFLSFTELRSLILSNNCFGDFIPKGDHRSKLSWKNLKTLDLSQNSFNESIMELISALSSLTNLVLADNEIGGPFPIKELSLLRNLEQLDLSQNSLYSRFTTQDYRRKLSWKNFKTLDLSENFFNESIMELISALPSLKNLVLANNEIGGPFPIIELSLLRNLELLDLSHNHLCNRFTTQDYRSRITWKNLKTLDLSYNSFNESIMELISALPSLKNLVLAYNEIGGPFLTKGMNEDNSSKSALETLDLSFNSVGGSITELLSTFPSLKNLILADNDMGGSFHMKVLANQSKLEVLDLRDSSINASFPNEGLCKMKQLQELYMLRNNFIGTLDACLGNLTSLRTLDLSENSLTGSIPEPLIVRLTSLEYLSLSSNEFEGLFSLNLFGNHSKLKVLELDNMNSKTFQVETESPPWIAPFQLERLGFSHCRVNFPSKIIPTFLSYQNGLRYIDLSGNNLVGMFPSWFLVNNTKLEEVHLNNNSFTGPFKLPFDLNHHMDQLYHLDLSNNQIQGELPHNIGFFLLYLDYFDVPSNMFDGHIPASIGEMSSLKELYLGHNNFSGKVPKDIVNGCIYLSLLMMDSNQLNGTLPTGIGKLDLITLTASRNNFEGAITEELCKLGFRILDLSHNKFSGALPSCFSMPSNYLFLQGNNLTGTITNEFISSSKMLAIDLSDNKFTGTIPENIYGLEHLRFLLLGGNQLQGQLSTQICCLQKIHILDLSRNKFTGSIPSCFNNLSFADMDLEKPIDPNRGFSRTRETPGEDRFKYSYEEVQFVTKGLSLSYKGDILQKMSGLDLSCNQLTREIPHQIGDIHALHALNLSHNHLSGPIPESFKKLESIESLDLSSNKLSGQIPLSLQDLHSLSVFNVSYNNLSGRAPDKGQFGTFDESSYKGNPYLSYNNSNRGIALLPPPPTPLNDGDKNESAIDFTSFYWSFGGSYVMVLVALVTILWINPHWRRAWFYFVEGCLLKCFGQFLDDAFY
ncbi:receptor-like protein 56 [Gastrolobium bilobum]|uniref:receptor-like protein 56 n=1 Tax=Gastrolobium bilobum TaxID=150636 RepID=UPI002AB2925C|nr:receptor-like protein 56 [Gastrolobium bilobum]